MSTIRYFSGARDQSKRSYANEMIRIEMQKKGKLTGADRYKRILKKQLDASKQKMLEDKVKNGFKIPGSFKEARKASKRAEHTLRQIAMKKAAKEAKALQRMVIVTPRVFSNGNITRKGKIYDVAGNLVAEVNTKNGRVQTAMTGAMIGRYKSGSYLTNVMIQNAIHQHSPYFINQRKLQAMQQQGMAADYGVWGPQTQEVINVYSPPPIQPQGEGESGSGMGGLGFGGPRQNIAASAWGARSDNVWGTYADNAWGTSTDNVWGTNTGDVWGGVGGSPHGMWGQKGPNLWGTGNGKNYISKVTAFLKVFFGLKIRNSEKAAAVNALRASMGRGAVARSSSTARSGPTATRSGR